MIRCTFGYELEGGIAGVSLLEKPLNQGFESCFSIPAGDRNRKENTDDSVFFLLVYGRMDLGESAC